MPDGSDAGIHLLLLRSRFCCTPAAPIERLIGEDVWPVTAGLSRGLWQVGNKICQTLNLDCNLTVTVTPQGTVSELGLQEGAHTESSSDVCVEVCRLQVYPQMDNGSKCERCGLAHSSVWQEARFASIDLVWSKGYNAGSALMGTTQSQMGQITHAVLLSEGFNVTAVPLKYQVLPAAVLVAPAMPVDSQAMQLKGWEVKLKIVSPTILPFTVERENMLLDATVSVQRRLPHSNAYFRVSHAKSSLKEHTLWVTLVINRQSFKHGAGHLTYKQLVDSEMPNIVAALEERGMKDVSARIVYAKPAINETLSYQMSKMAGLEEETALPWLWPAFATLSAGIALLMLAVGLPVLPWHRYGSEKLRSGSSMRSVDEFTSNPFNMPDCDRKLNQLPLITGDKTEMADIEIVVRPDGKNWLLGTGTAGKALRVEAIVGFDGMTVLSGTDAAGKASGPVYRGLKNGCQDVAIKVLNHTGKAHLQQFENEIRLLKGLSFDRNIVQFYGACLKSEGAIMVLEYMAGGDLMEAIAQDKNGELKWMRRGHLIALDVARALVFLHRNKVIHLDVKSKNILMNQDRSLAKLADVGISRIVHTTIGANTSGNNDVAFPVGTFEYSAPEILVGKYCNEKVDIYAAGVVLWEIVTHMMPVRGQMRDIDPSECPPEIAALIIQCLSEDPEERPTARQMFETINVGGDGAVWLTALLLPSASTLCMSAPLR
eukprot:jgi/Astpho2/7929/fgenesh1_pg.00118_%23_34_t